MAEKTSDAKKLDIVKASVIRVNNIKTLDTVNTIDHAGIGDIIVIHVDSLAALIATTRDQKLRLFINGRQIENIEPLSGAPDLNNGSVQFRLDRNTNNNKTWADILGGPPIGADFFNTPVKVSVGYDNGVAIKAKTSSNNNYNFELARIHKGWFWTCLVILIIYLYLLFTMTKSKGLLRDRTIDLSAIGIKNNVIAAYSLGRFQMAFWFTLTVMSFFFIWLICHIPWFQIS